MDEIQNFINDYLLHCKYEKNLSPLSLKAYSVDLKQFYQFIKKFSVEKRISCIDKNILREYLKELFTRNKTKTIKRKVASLKAFLNHLEFEDVIEINPFRKVRVNLREGKQLPKVIDLYKIKKIFAYLYSEKERLTDKSSKYQCIVRDIAVLELLFATGVRVAELSNIKTNDLNLSKGYVLIKGKGNRERVIPIVHHDIIDALKTYYELFREQIKNGEFFFINRSFNRLSEQSIRFMIKKHVQSINISQRITPHMFRHSVATYLLENGADIRYIQNILGHSTINTTQIYTQVNEGPKRRLIKLKHPRGKFSFK